MIIAARIAYHEARASRYLDLCYRKLFAGGDHHRYQALSYKHKRIAGRLKRQQRRARR